MGVPHPHPSAKTESLIRSEKELCKSSNCGHLIYLKSLAYTHEWYITASWYPLPLCLYGCQIRGAGHQVVPNLVYPCLPKYHFLLRGLARPQYATIRTRPRLKNTFQSQKHRVEPVQSLQFRPSSIHRHPTEHQQGAPSRTREMGLFIRSPSPHWKKEN
jgi:hypothetical protein